MQRIAVMAGEKPFINYAQLLRENGFDVVVINPQRKNSSDLADCAAVIISGMDRNMAGMQDIKTTAPVIDATGMTAEQVLQEIRRKVLH